MSNLHAFLPELSSFVPYQPFGDGGSIAQESFYPAISDEGTRAELQEISDAKGMAEMQAELALCTQAMEEKFAADLQQARNAWADEVGSSIDQKLADAMAGIEERISRSLNDVLLPFVEKLIPRAAAADFLGLVKEAVQEDFKGALHLSGPSDIIAAISQKLELRNVAIMCEPAAGLELRAKSKDFVITTRMQDWLDDVAGKTP